jgi:hypothetical protein
LIVVGKFLKAGFKLATPVIAIIAIAFLLYAPFVLTVWKAGGIRSRSSSLEELKGEFATLHSKTAAIEMRIGKLKKRDRLEKISNETTLLNAPTAQNVLIIERDKKGVLHQKDEGVVSFLERLMGGSK